MQKSNLKDRFRSLIDHYNLPVAEVVSKVGITKATYHNIMNGTSKPDFKTTEAILDAFPDVSAEWFMRGEGEMFKGRIATLKELEDLQMENSIFKKMLRDALKESELVGKAKGMSNSPIGKKNYRKSFGEQAIASTRGRKKNSPVAHVPGFITQLLPGNITGNMLR